MSVPSPKAEPMKLWLAQVGKQAIDEAENPELLTERQIELYKAKGTFGITPKEHKELKSLTNPSQNLRDYMTDLELILTALGEAVTRTVAIEKDAQGFDQNKTAAMKGGKAGGDARRNVEKQIGKSVLSSEIFLNKEDKLSPPQ